MITFKAKAKCDGLYNRECKAECDIEVALTEEHNIIRNDDGSMASSTDMLGFDVVKSPNVSRWIFHKNGTTCGECLDKNVAERQQARESRRKKNALVKSKKKKV